VFSAIRLINRLIKTCQAPAQDKSEQIQGDTTAAKSTLILTSQLQARRRLDCALIGCGQRGGTETSYFFGSAVPGILP
jgi:hypothetical protein